MLSSSEHYVARHPRSKQLAERASKVSRGIHHDARHLVPFPIFGDRAEGIRVWDVDGHEYIDYTMGHGALLLGHAHPLLVDAVMQQIQRGTHYGFENELGLEWAELITRLIPAAERVEFVLSGTEANMLIVQIARAFTGRNKILKFARHFAGWADHLYAGVDAPYDRPSGGRLGPATEDATSEWTVVLPCNDVEAMEKALMKEDAAALFLEGAGASGGTVGMPPELVHRARELTQKHGTLLVIDEVITGFRWSPGGYQFTVGVTPDLSALGKVVAGGLPGAAVCGRADAMEMLQTKPGQPEFNRYRRVVHPGTWNANPLSAAAGVAMLKAVSSGEPQKEAAALAARLAEGMNGKLREMSVEGCVFRTASVVHIHLGPCQRCDGSACLDATKAMAPEVVQSLHRSMLMHGISFLHGTLGFVSAVHTEEAIERTVEAFGLALRDMQDEGAIT